MQKKRRNKRNERQMKKNGQEEEDTWWRKNNRTKEEKQEVRNKEGSTQTIEAKATRQNRHKHRKGHGKIINHNRHEEVKTNEISDKRGE